MGESAADQYTNYVTAVLPLSRKLAEATARLKEFAIFKQATSTAQSKMSVACDALVAIARMIPHARPTSSYTAEDGTVDIEQALTQLNVATQILALRRVADEEIKAFREVAAGLSPAEPRDFRNYTVQSLQMQFERTDFSVVDGIHPIIIIVPGDPSVVIASIVVSFGLTVWQVLANTKELDQIRDASERLQRESLRDAEYQTFAMDACAAYMPAFRETFAAYEVMIAALDTWQQSYSTQLLEQWQSALLKAVEMFDQQVVARLERSVQDELRARLGAQEEHAQQLELAIGAKLRIRRNLDALTAAPCAGARSIIASLEADLSLAKLMKLDSVLNLAPRIRVAQQSFRTRCGRRPPSLQPDVEANPMVAARSDSTLALAELPATQTCVYIEDYAFGSFCRNLHTRQSGTGATTTASGGYCQTSSTLSFSLCGGGLTGGAGGGWSVLREFIASGGDLPGSYNARRGEFEGERLERSRAEIDQRERDLRAILRDLEESHRKYRDQAVVPAIRETIRTVEQSQEEINRSLLPVLAEVVGAAPPPAVPASLVPATIDLASPALRQRAAKLATLRGPSAELWDNLEPVYDVAGNDTQHLPGPDLRALMDVYGAYFDANGIGRAAVVGVSFAQAAGDLGSGLLTEIHSADGHAVRREVNRDLVTLALSTDVMTRGVITGALGLVAAADIAYANRERPGAEWLLSTALGITDFALGLTPIAPLNDAAQLVHGMMTGRDIAGNEMAVSDFVLRGLGVMIGAVPGAKQFMNLGGEVLSRAFVEGCALLRRTDLRGAFFEYTAKAPTLAKSFAEFIGEWLPWEAIGHEDPMKISMMVNRIVLFERDLAANVNREWMSRVWRNLRETGRAADENAVKLFRSRPFVGGEVPADGVFARVVPRASVDEITQGTQLLGPSPFKEAFITSAGDLLGLSTSDQVARKLGLYSDEAGTVLRRLNDHVILRFKFKGPGIVSPVNLELPYLRDAGWIFAGFSKGGAREWIIDADAAQKGLLEFVDVPFVIKP